MWLPDTDLDRCLAASASFGACRGSIEGECWLEEGPLSEGCLEGVVPPLEEDLDNGLEGGRETGSKAYCSIRLDCTEEFSSVFLSCSMSRWL